MKRLDWLDRLWETIEARKAMPFRWAGADGGQDCCTLAAACIDAMTDGAKLAALLTHYTDEESARAYIVASGGIAAAIDPYLGARKPLGFMGRGDIAVFVEAGIEFVGVCVGNKIACAGGDGVTYKPREFATVCWGI